MIGHRQAPNINANPNPNARERRRTGPPKKGRAPRRLRWWVWSWRRRRSYPRWITRCTLRGFWSIGGKRRWRNCMSRMGVRMWYRCGWWGMCRFRCGCSGCDLYFFDRCAATMVDSFLDSIFGSPWSNTMIW